MELKAFVEKCKDEGHFIEIFNSGNPQTLLEWRCERRRLGNFFVPSL